MIGGTIIQVVGDYIEVKDGNESEWRYIHYGETDLRPSVGDLIWWKSLEAYWTPESKLVSDYNLGECLPADPPWGVSANLSFVDLGIDWIVSNYETD